MLNPLLISRKENAGILRRICSELGAVPREIIGEDWSLSLFLKCDLKNYLYQSHYIFDISAFKEKNDDFVNLCAGIYYQKSDANIIIYADNCYPGDEILDKLSQKMKLTEPYRVMNEKSLYQRRDRKKEAFVPQAVTEVTEQADSEEMNEYVLKPLYTQKEIREFRKQNEQDGNFIVTKDTVKSMEDLEKLFLVWQDATEVAERTEEIEVGEELENENGLRFSKLVIKKSQ